jgi:hypothetical protein
LGFILSHAFFLPSNRSERDKRKVVNLDLLVYFRVMESQKLSRPIYNFCDICTGFPLNVEPTTIARRRSSGKLVNHNAEQTQRGSIYLFVVNLTTLLSNLDYIASKEKVIGEW